MSNWKIGEEIILDITAVGSIGDAIGENQGFKFFVDGPLPGEKVVATIKHLKKTYGIAELVRITHPSPFRVASPCPYFGNCGGCQIMQLRYDQQLVLKRQRVVDAFERIGHLSSIQVHPCLPSPKEFGYRNKIQIPVLAGLNGKQIGFFAKRSHAIVPIEKCLVHCESGDEVYRTFRRLLLESRIPAYSEKENTGCLRFVLIKSAIQKQESLIILVHTGSHPKEIEELASAICMQLPQITGVVGNINKRTDNVVLGGKWHLLSGKNYIEETLLGLKWKISAAAFFQVNPYQASNLYQKALDYAEITTSDHVLDGYCGVGTLSLLAARQAKEVIGIEVVSQAIENARENAQLNQIKNCQFKTGKIEEIIEEIDPFDVALINPPRKGCHSGMIAALNAKKPKRIVYLSCDPATLARDLALLCDGGYWVEEAQPVDMFPQTMHVETVVRLTLS